MNVNNSSSRCSLSGQQSILISVFYLYLLQVICTLHVLPYLAPFKWNTQAFFTLTAKNSC